MEHPGVASGPAVEGKPSAAVRTLIRRGTDAPSGLRGPNAVNGPTGEKGELYRNFGDGFTRAFELAVTPVIFGAMGYGLDRWIGIVPVLTTVFTLLAVVGLLLRTWYGYVYRMQSIERDGPWAR